MSTLSGGERNRLLLARLFARPANLLVLDEPTNDLDIESLELLEETLQSYAGTLLLVSHDRAFLDNVVTQTLVAEGDGVWREYAGGYTDWLAQRPVAVPDAAPSRKGAPQTPRPERPPKLKLSYKEERELLALPDEIEALEAEQQALTQRMCEPDYHRSDAAVLRRTASVPRRSSTSSRRSSSAGRCWTRWRARQARAPADTASSRVANPWFRVTACGRSLDAPGSTPMQFIFMLTHNDRTVEDAERLVDQVCDLGVMHIGFKDVGLASQAMRRLVDADPRARRVCATSKSSVRHRHPCDARSRWAWRSASTGFSAGLIS